jgi:hypothetical protein
VKIRISAINKFYRTSAINKIIGFIEILSPIKFSLLVIRDSPSLIAQSAGVARPSTFQLEPRLAVSDNRRRGDLELSPSSIQPPNRNFLYFLASKDQLARHLTEHKGEETPTVDSCIGAPQWETHPHELATGVGAEHQQGTAELGGTCSTPASPPTPQQLRLETKPQT